MAAEAPPSAITGAEAASGRARTPVLDEGRPEVVDQYMSSWTFRRPATGDNVPGSAAGASWRSTPSLVAALRGSEVPMTLVVPHVPDWRRTRRVGCRAWDRPPAVWPLFRPGRLPGQDRFRDASFLAGSPALRGSESWFCKRDLARRTRYLGTPTPHAVALRARPQPSAADHQRHTHLEVFTP